MSFVLFFIVAVWHFIFYDTEIHFGAFNIADFEHDNPVIRLSNHNIIDLDDPGQIVLTGIPVHSLGVQITYAFELFLGLLRIYGLV